MTAAPRARAAARLLELGVKLEARERVVPRSLEQLRHRAERLVAGAVVPVSTVRSAGDETCLEKRAKLERDRAERDVWKGAVNGARGKLALPNEAQDLAASRGGDDGEHVGVEHGLIFS